MYAEAVNPQEVSFAKFLVYSLCLHTALVAWIGLVAYLQYRGNPWSALGNEGNGSVKVNLVGSLAGIPLPNQPVVTDSRTVDPTKGLYKEDPKPKTPEPLADATNLPKFKENKPQRISRPSRVFEPKTPPPPNAVDYGQGGQPRIQSGYGANSGGAPGGVGMQGQGGGDFATRYGWYVEAVKRRISGNWMQNTIDSNILAGRSAHAIVTFTILKDGTVKDARISQTSGNSSMDNSGVRAILSSNPMPALPGDYSGSYVVVTFDFDLGMKR